MTISTTKEKRSRSSDRRKIEIILGRHLLRGINRRKGFPSKLSAGRPPAERPPPSSLPPENTSTIYDMDMNPKTRDTIVRSMLRRPFKKVCKLLSNLDQDKDFDLISETIQHFSLKIYGLPECRPEDLLLAVYFFIEDTFGIQSKIELCVELEEGESVVIGVVFKTIQMKYDILKKDCLLEGAEVRLRNNTDLDWIVEALSK